ncbi:MAG: hypothetical protein GWM98_24645 [Nitrospinaceae bacterium]|nr:hypothetical protein [Nitrospinaceae bacterium]NIR57065.1 hypothetical protein [Nitrospinaceae bacterium]NIT84376.1 hypothetical protein [Nitrospinaceae bacterium]NIU46563.1 hypothetical protein [Nitrospinaceae bacterium]NIU98755.1 hypothetical protein [Nitrospinaceae bacterium]
MSILKQLSKMFSTSRSQPESSPESSPADSQVDPSPNFVEPLQRRVIQAPDIVEDGESFRDSPEILIKAAPSPDFEQCKFMVNRPLFEGRSWLFSKFEEAAGSPLAEQVFSVDSVETLLVHDSTAMVTKTGVKSLSEWEKLARAVGASIRQALEAGADPISMEIIDKIPDEAVVREEIQKIIDNEVNPGVAGHGGRITLTRVEGNTVTIEMGGGCQGCSAADLTLKQGIHNAFRKAAPYVGAIYDETDHAAGLNPFYR